MGSSVIIAVIVFLLSFISVKRRWKSMESSPCGLAADWNRLKRWLSVIALFHYTHKRTHTRGPVRMCNHTMSMHWDTNLLHYWLLQKEIAIRLRLGFNWSRLQFNASRGLTVIGGRKRWRGEGIGEEILQTMTLKPAALDDRNSCDVTHKDATGSLRKHGQRSGRGGMGDIKLNLIPISLWSLRPDLGYF